MFCSKCGNQIAVDDAFCRRCGTSVQNEESLQQADDLKSAKTKRKGTLPIILLAIGSGLALLITIISVAIYQEIYFFDGYLITAIGWIVAIASVVIGAVLFVINLFIYGPGGYVRTHKKHLVLAVVLVLVIPAILIVSAIMDSGTDHGSYNYYNDPQYYQNTFESCHSTYEHIQAIYSYDLNNDNELSSYEMELFIKAHPRVTQDKQFMDWAERRVG